MALPKVIYVYEEKESDGSEYLCAMYSPDGLPEGKLGVYKLEEKLEIRHQPQLRRPGTKTWFNAGK
jgi:hypothetical protein